MWILHSVSIKHTEPIEIVKIATRELTEHRDQLLMTWKFFVHAQLRPKGMSNCRLITNENLWKWSAEAQWRETGSEEKFFDEKKLMLRRDLWNGGCLARAGVGTRWNLKAWGMHRVNEILYWMPIDFPTWCEAGKFCNQLSRSVARVFAWQTGWSWLTGSRLFTFTISDTFCHCAIMNEDE